MSILVEIEQPFNFKPLEGATDVVDYCFTVKLGQQGPIILLRMIIS